MSIVQLICIACGKLSEVEGVEYLQMKKEGLIVDTSYKGRVKRHKCCQKKAPSRGKKSKGKTPTKPKKPTKTTDDRQQKYSPPLKSVRLSKDDVDELELSDKPVGYHFETDRVESVMHRYHISKKYKNGTMIVALDNPKSRRK